MLKIAICDPDLNVIGEIRMLINNCKLFHNLDYEIEEFNSENLLFESLNCECRYQLIYLNIEKDGNNNIDIAKKLRRLDKEFLLIYLSSSQKFFPQIFDAEPFRFLGKPIDKDDFIEILQSAYQRIEDKKSCKL